MTHPVQPDRPLDMKAQSGQQHARRLVIIGGLKDAKPFSPVG